MRMPAVLNRLSEWIATMADDGLLEQYGGNYQQDRRNYPRYRPTSMKWRIEVSEHDIDGVLENISVGGACIRCPGGKVPPEPGTEIVVSFLRPGPDTLLAKVIAVSGVDRGYMLHLAWSLDQDHAVERVNSLLQFASV